MAGQPWTYPLAFPTSPLARKSKITALVAASTTRSPFTYDEQAFLYDGAAWAIELQWPPMRRAQAEYFIAVGIKLQGRFGTFLAYDHDGANPRGTAVGTPLVNGNGQTGYQLATKGWTPGQAGVLLTGDYVQLGAGATARVYKVTDDAAADGSGHATLNIWPPLRRATLPVDNDALTIRNASSQFRLDTDFSWDADEVSTYGVSITGTEAL